MDWYRMKELRRCSGLRQAEVAAELGVDRQTVHRWEVGRHAIPPKIEGRFVTLINDTERVAWIKRSRPSFVRGRPFVKKGAVV